jgi:hypothetical protein
MKVESGMQLQQLVFVQDYVMGFEWLTGWPTPAFLLKLYPWTCAVNGSAESCKVVVNCQHVDPNVWHVPGVRALCFHSGCSPVMTTRKSDSCTALLMIFPVSHS